MRSINKFGMFYVCVLFFINKGYATNEIQQILFYKTKWLFIYIKMELINILVIVNKLTSTECFNSKLKQTFVFNVSAKPYNELSIY